MEPGSASLIPILLDLGVPGIIIFFAILVVRGDVVLRREIDGVTSYYEARIKETSNHHAEQLRVMRERLQAAAEREEEWKGWALKSTLAAVQIGRTAVERENVTG